MKLAIFGGSGRTGQILIRQALAAGHEISALARTPEKIPAAEPLRVVQGDLDSPGAVISVLEPASNTPDSRVSRGIEHILAAMEAHGVRRLLLSTGAGVADPMDAPGPFNRLMSLLLRLLARHVLEDMTRTVERVRASDRDWTIVRVPMLTDDPPTGRVTAATVGRGLGLRASRADLAAFLLAQLEIDTYLRQAPAISS